MENAQGSTVCEQGEEKMETAQGSTVCEQSEQKPATIQSFQDLCEQRVNDAKKQVTVTLLKWLESKLASNMSWRAWFEKNKRGKFIPTRWDIFEYEPIEERRYHKLYWPNLPKEEIYKCLEELGYIVSKFAISISVPMQVEGKAETFAQQWANKINLNYSIYCIKERIRASEYYKEIMNAIFSSTASDLNLVEGDYYSITLNGGMLDSHGVFYREVQRLFAKDGIKTKLITAPNSVKTEYLIPRKKETE